MMTRTFLALALAVGTLGVTIPLSHLAAANWSWENSAPEALEVTVLSARDEKRYEPKGPNCNWTIHEYTITAKVDVVHRSASGVQPGRTITFKNTVTWTGCPIPRGDFGAMVHDGDRAEAYLKPAETPDGAFVAVHVKKLR